MCQIAPMNNDFSEIWPLIPDPCNLYLYTQRTFDLGIQLIVVKPH
jgi:hypothetical protein